MRKQQASCIHTIRLTADQDRKLNRFCQVLGISRGEVIRRLVDAATVHDVLLPVQANHEGVSPKGLGKGA